MTESELLDLLKNPATKSRGFTYLFDTYKERLYYHIRSIVHSHTFTDDVLQNSFVKIYRHIDTFEGKSKLYTWIYRIATNEALSFLQQEAKHRQATIDDVRISAAETFIASEYFDLTEAEKKLEKALAQLPHRQALVFSLYHDQHLKLGEIATLLDSSLGNIKALHHLAQKKIKKLLLSY